MNRGAVAVIDLNAISYNLNVIKTLSHNKPVIAVVKADAYGHGAVAVSERLVKEGVYALAVAFTDEARELREAGVSAPIVVLFDPDIRDIIFYNLIPVVSDIRTAKALSEEAEGLGRRLHVHIKVDTGMGRMGIFGDEARHILEIANMKGLHIDGVLSHFAEADLYDTSFVRSQIERVEMIRSGLSNKGLPVQFFHIANSAAVMTIPDAHFDAVRPGLMLYGCSPIGEADRGNKESADGERLQAYTRHVKLMPAMTVKARILSLRRLPAGIPISYGRTFVTKRESLIGVLSIGYADGFSRGFSNNADVIVSGRKAPVVGRVCMDLTMVDLTDIQGISEGEEAIIIGRHGDVSIDAWDLAQRIDTIPYEILTSLGSKAKRVYLNGA